MNPCVVPGAACWVLPGATLLVGPDDPSATLYTASTVRRLDADLVLVLAVGRDRRWACVTDGASVGWVDTNLLSTRGPLSPSVYPGRQVSVLSSPAPHQPAQS